MICWVPSQTSRLTWSEWISGAMWFQSDPVHLARRLSELIWLSTSGRMCSWPLDVTARLSDDCTAPDSSVDTCWPGSDQDFTRFGVQVSDALRRGRDRPRCGGR